MWGLGLSYRCSPGDFTLTLVHTQPPAGDQSDYFSIPTSYSSSSLWSREGDDGYVYLNMSVSSEFRRVVFLVTSVLWWIEENLLIFQVAQLLFFVRMEATTPRLFICWRWRQTSYFLCQGMFILRQNAIRKPKPWEKPAPAFQPCAWTMLVMDPSYPRQDAQNDTTWNRNKPFLPSPSPTAANWMTVLFSVFTFWGGSLCSNV